MFYRHKSESMIQVSICDGDRNSAIFAVSAIFAMGFSISAIFAISTISAMGFSISMISAIFAMGFLPV